MDGSIIIGTELDTKSFDAQIEELEDKLDTLEQEYEAALKDAEFPEDELKKYQAEIEKTKNKIIDLKEKQDKLNDIGSLNTGAITNLFNSIGNKAQQLISKTARWGLALLGIRSAYSGIRSAISMVSNQNEEVAIKIQQMKNVLIGVITPYVQTIVNLLAKTMIYINYIFNALTGKNLFNFADATKNSSDNLKKGSKSAGGIANNLKEARKQLAGFDEMNVLNDNVSSSGGGGGAGIDTSGFENIFDKLKDIKIPKWIEDLTKALKTLKKYWKEVIIVVGSFASAILALKITNFIADLLKLSNVTTAIKTGIGLMVSGIVMLVGAIINLTMNWDTMTSKEKTINIALASIGAGFVALGYAIMTGISVATLGIGLLIAAIIAMTTSLATQIITEQKAIDKIYDEKVQTEELTKAKDKAKQAYDDLISAVDRQAEAQENLTRIEQENQMSGEELYNSVQNGTLTYQGMTKQQRETYKAYLDLINANENLTKANEDKIASDSRVVKGNYDVQIANDKTGRTYDKLRDDIIDSYKKGEMTAQDTSDSISRMMGNMSNDSYQTFTKDIPDDIKSGLDPGKYRSTWDKFKDNWNNWINSLKRKIGIEVNANVSSSGGHGFAKGGIVVPKLASGGIINQPGRGVPLASAIGGERGQEGVIPLTDSQQMALLGEAIGRYITINANITNTMNGRVISRELQRINADDNFAFNR